jgi:hypothetical protein
MAQWRDHPAAASAWQVVDGAIDAGAIPGVLQHNDLGSWNIAADGTEFTVLDWESARPVGLPLWDLVYFLTDALTALDGPAPSTLKVDRMLRLLGGRSPESPTLFAHVSRTAQALGLERGAVGSIVTLGWLHHALSAPARRRAVAVASSVDGGPALGRLALGWLTDPALGSRWRAWSQ